MVVYGTVLLLICCTCLQHIGALQLANDPYKRADVGLKERGEHLGALTERQNRRQKRANRKDCNLDWNGNFLPIILKETNHELVNPDGQKIIRIPADEGVIISCERNLFETPALGKSLRQKSIAAVRAYCNPATGKLVVTRERTKYLSVFISPLQSGTQMLAGTKESDDIDYFRCQEPFQPTTIAITELDKNNHLYTKKKCSKSGDEYHIVTFDTITKGFFTQIEVCFDKTKQTTLWTRHILRGGKSLVDKIQPTWREDYGIFSFSMERRYQSINKPISLPTNKALETLSELLGQEVRPPQNKIAKGHLSPNADFKTQDQRNATFQYINSLPQWHADNNGNWVHIVEVSVRALVNNLAKKEPRGLTIITGGHETLYLRNVNTNPNTDEPIYIGAGKVPVPEFMWKVVVNEAKNKGVAFYIINNPFVKKPLSPTPPDDLCAEDVCDKLDTSWFKAKLPSRTNYSKGYTFCCRVDDLRKKIKTIPEEYANISDLLGE